MCEANAYLVEKDTETLVMESVDAVKPDGEGISLVNIFGDQKFLKARIHSLSLIDHKIYLEQIPG